MEFSEVVRLRTSIRDYDKSRAVKREDLDYILSCAQLSPSACNKQPWRILVIESESKLNSVYEFYNRDWIRTAPMVLAVVVNHDEAWHRSSYDNKDHSDVDASILIEHICLAAADRKLGTCWICNFNPSVSNDLGLTANEELIALIPLGYPKDESLFKKDKIRKPVSELVKFI